MMPLGSSSKSAACAAGSISLNIERDCGSEDSSGSSLPSPLGPGIPLRRENNYSYFPDLQKYKQLSPEEKEVYERVEDLYLIVQEEKVAELGKEDLLLLVMALARKLVQKEEICANHLTALCQASSDLSAALGKLNLALPEGRFGTWERLDRLFKRGESGSSGPT